MVAIAVIADFAENAVVFNTMINGGDASAHFPLTVIKYAGRWLADNLIGVALLWRMFWPEAVKRIRYEDLASDPERTLGEICNWLDISFDADRTSSTRFAVNHGVAGNKPRWESLPVTFEENWRVTMPPLHQRLISLVTAPLAHLWSSSRLFNYRHMRKC